MIPSTMFNRISKNGFVLIVLVTLSLGRICLAQEQADQPKLTFDEHIKPILTQRCSTCHGSSRKESDLDVTNYTALMMGGGSGEVIEPGSSSDSYLYRLVTHEESPEMPPGGKIPAGEIEKIAAWIEMGALENASSKPKKAKPKVDLSLDADASVRPESIAYPARIPLEPVIQTARPAVTALAASPWAPLFAVAAPRQVLLYSADSLELIGVLPVDEGVVHQLRFSRNGSLLLGGGGKDASLGTVILWDVETGNRIATLGEEADAVLTADISGNQQWLALGGPAKIVKVFALSDASLRFEINKHTEWITALEFSPDSKMLASGDRNGGLHVWDLETGAEIFALSGHTQSINSLAWRSDSRVLASASEDSNVRVWEMDKGASIKNWGAHAGGTTAIRFLRNGEILTGGRDHQVKLWKQDGNLVRQFSGLSDVVIDVAGSDEVQRIIGADWTGKTISWNRDDAAAVGELIANPPTLAQRLAQANQTLATYQQELAPFQSALDLMEAKLNELTSEMASLENQKAVELNKQAPLQEQISASMKELEQLDQTATTMETEHATLAQTVPLLQDASEKLHQIATLLSDDGQWIQMRDQLQAKMAGVNERQSQLESMISGSKQQQTTLQQMLEPLKQQLASSLEGIATFDTMIGELQTQIEPLQTQRNEQSKQVAEVMNKIEQAQNQVTKWTEQIEFVQLLTQLSSDLINAEEELFNQEQAEQELKERLSALEKELDQARQQKLSTVESVNAIQQKIDQLRSADDQNRQP